MFGWFIQPFHISISLFYHKLRGCFFSFNTIKMTSIEANKGITANVGNSGTVDVAVGERVGFAKAETVCPFIRLSVIVFQSLLVAIK